MNKPPSGHPRQDWEVEEALRTYPLAPVPPALTPAVMTRIRALSPALRFRLEWLDLALSVFGAAMTVLALSLWQSISPPMAAHLRVQFLLWRQQLSLLAFEPVLLGSLLMALLALLTVSLYLAPRRYR